MPIFSNINLKIKCTKVIDTNHRQYANNPKGIKRKAMEFDDSSLGELSNYEGIDTHLVPSLTSDILQVSSETSPVDDTLHALPPSSIIPALSLLASSVIHYYVHQGFFYDFGKQYYH